jgi:uncharacterized protein YjbK
MEQGTQESAGVERELKYMLTREGWEALRAWARASGAWVSEAEQRNTYFDLGADALGTRRVSLRLREKGGKFLLCYKRQTHQDGAQMHSEEQEEVVGAEVAARALGEPASLLGSGLRPVVALEGFALQEKLDLSALRIVGELWTQRAVLRLGEFLLELDWSVYGGTEDFEVECETARLEEAEGQLLGLLGALGVSHEASTRPKVARMRAARAR